MDTDTEEQIEMLQADANLEKEAQSDEENAAESLELEAQPPKRRRNKWIKISSVIFLTLCAGAGVVVSNQVGSDGLDTMVQISSPLKCIPNDQFYKWYHKNPDCEYEKDKVDQYQAEAARGYCVQDVEEYLEKCEGSEEYVKAYSKVTWGKSLSLLFASLAPFPTLLYCVSLWNPT